ncbi:hypothetical protein J2T55_000516 [Methylohalomonas lacus]|uniref:DUF4112 domain-containing protein n=1 Tax=Methylohalomonas lacus TaxID=398773 RepID=A0AAE3HKC4_9GAMM|nr:DUF4112 domain-containing protein [Methylohalomonas lacus]MCS3902512.1 hypothetical protein [Methylohalomonas lacus]
MAYLPSEPAALRRARRLARLLDSAFRLPGTRWRFGWDALIGLAPGIGDLITAVVSVYIIRLAGELDVPLMIRLRMLANVLLDFIVGSVPLVGDLFDAGFKANLRNLALIERHRAEPRSLEE